MDRAALAGRRMGRFTKRAWEQVAPATAFMKVLTIAHLELPMSLGLRFRVWGVGFRV